MLLRWARTKHKLFRMDLAFAREVPFLLLGWRRSHSDWRPKWLERSHYFMCTRVEIHDSQIDTGTDSARGKRDYDHQWKYAIRYNTFHQELCSWWTSCACFENSPSFRASESLGLKFWKDNIRSAIRVDEVLPLQEIRWSNWGGIG